MLSDYKGAPAEYVAMLDLQNLIFFLVLAFEVQERERGREGGRVRGLCVCVRERERKREIQRDRERDRTDLQNLIFFLVLAVEVRPRTGVPRS